MKVGVLGCNGRVGNLLIQELKTEQWKHRGLILSGGTMRSAASPAPDFFITSDPEELIIRSDVVIDFTLPEGTLKHIELVKKHHKKIVIGTTGLSADDENEIKIASDHATIVYAANMSLGVNILLALVEKAAEALSEDWDIEIFESHHKHKVDAPSGTALAIGKAAASGRGHSLEDLADYNRHGHTGARERGKIGFSVARGGDVVGEHTAFFFGEGERIELTHKATNRALFARGALHAAKWCDGKPNGLFSMRDVLGI